MKPLHRALIVLASFAALFVIWRTPNSVLATLVLGACVTWFGRAAYRSGFAKNPLGKDRDYSIGPAMRYGLTALVLVAAAFAWVVALAKVVPDTNLGAVILFGPSLLAIAASAIYIFKALSRYQLGGRK